MDDQFDNDLKDRIREVFDKFEDPSADEGWLLLREKFPVEQAKRRALAWLWWSAAALLLLFLGIGLWKYSNNSSTQIVVKNHGPAPVNHMAGTKTKPETTKKTQPDSIKTPVTPAPLNTMARVNTPPVKSQKIASNSLNGSNKLSPGNNTAANRSVTPRTIYTPPVVNPQPPVQQLATTVQTNSQAISPGIIKPAMPVKPAVMAKLDTLKRKVNAPPANQLAANTQAGKPWVNPADTKPANPANPASSINAMLAQDNPKKRRKDDDMPPRVRFGVYAGTYFNYSKGSGNAKNVGAGFTADIRITKNLSVVTGASITPNSLNFGSGVPTPLAQSSLTFPGAAAAVPGANRAFSLSNSVTAATQPAFKNYNASMFGLDIPVNLKYNFNPKRNEIYLLAGLSSGTFINETYIYQYNYPAFLSPALQQVQNETSHKSFNSFYFAKMLNLAVGVGYPAGRNRLVLEPFVKYPLDGLGAQNIKFGSGGLNLKFSFAPGRK